MPSIVISTAKWLVLPLLLLVAAVLGLANYRRHANTRFLYLFRVTFLLGLALLIFAPAIRRELSRTQRPELRVLVDASLSMSLDDGRGRSRAERARAVVEQLERSFGDAFRISASTFGASLKPWPDAKSAAAVPPREPASDLSGALKALTSSSDQAQVRGLFVLTDGAHTSTTPPAVWARTSQTPIFTVGIGSEQYAYKDLAVAAVEAPEVAFKESNLTFTVRVKSRGLPDKERISVTLSLAGRALENQTAELDDGAATVRFAIKPEKAGLNVYRVTLPQQTGELSHANNARDVSVFVEEKPREILLISTQPTWETAFLRRTLAQDPRFALKAHELMLKGKTFDWQPSELARYRLVILNRFQPNAFRGEQIAALLEYVQRGEGALLVLGTTPEDSDELFNSELAKVLPVGRPEGRWETPKRLNVGLTPLGSRHPACSVLPHPQANLLAWKNLPPILPSVIVSASTEMAAPVLASFPYYPKDIVAIAYRFFGRGLTVWINSYETHLLKLLPAAAEDRDNVHATFTANLLDWMTDQARSAGASLMLARLRFSQGEPVDIAVNDYQGLLEGPEIALAVRREGHPTPMTVKLARTDDGIAGSFTPEVPGVYTISLPVPGRAPVEKTILVQEDARELENPFANLAALRELAQGSGGAFFAEGDPGLARLALDASPLVLTVHTEKMWLDEGTLLALLLLVICVEWVIRRQRHLV